MIPMDLARVIISETSEEQIIVLKERQGSRAFPIVIGIFEAFAIDRNLKEKRTPRPMTHDLLASVIGHLDASLERVVVNDLRDRTFYAQLHLRRNGTAIEVDSRPSDAIALAVLMGAPIFVEERVLEAMSQEPEPPPFQTWSPEEEPPPEE